jgi:nitronate monooxygenase/enoyl-[acyl-carrier protein] reductase II
MIRTPLCDLLGIDVPVICAPFGPWDEVELAAAVCRAGGLGSLGTAARPLPDLRDQWARLRRRTDRPFAINHTPRPFDEAAFAATLDEHPAVISYHMGDPGELVERAHAAGILWMQQVGDVDQARVALDRGVDVLIAQGGEAGGHSGFVSTFVLVPQVAEAAGKVPVVAAGGIVDGRGLAAALALGAQGVAMGTRFLASEEMRIDPEWKRMVVRAGSSDAVQAAVVDTLLPPFNRSHAAVLPRVLRTPAIDGWIADPAGLAERLPELGPELMRAVAAGGGHEYVPFAGQSAGLIHDVRPAAAIVHDTVAVAAAILARLGQPASRASTMDTSVAVGTTRAK